MAFDLGSAIGPVNCRIRMRDDGTITCETHGDVLQNAEETKAHIKEKNVEWHRQQDAIDAIRRAYEKQAQAAEFVGVYHLHFEDMDVMDVHFHAQTLEDLRDQMLRAREVFRK